MEKNKDLIKVTIRGETCYMTVEEYSAYNLTLN